MCAFFFSFVIQQLQYDFLKTAVQDLLLGWIYNKPCSWTLISDKLQGMHKHVHWTLANCLNTVIYVYLNTSV